MIMSDMPVRISFFISAQVFLAVFWNGLHISSLLGNVLVRAESQDIPSSCGCPSDKSQPVCGTDGVTYDSFCHVRCASKKSKGLGGRCRGKCPCEELSALTNVICEVKNNCPTQVPKGQLCGTDNITYADACIFLCAQQSMHSLGVQCGGSCPCPEAQTACAKCPDEYRPVCGNNNVTYGNQCMFSCARMANSTLYPTCRSECPCPSLTKSAMERFHDHLKKVFLVSV